MKAMFLQVALVLITCADHGIGQEFEPIDRSNLSLKLLVHYPEEQLHAHRMSDRFELRGNGLGLSWSVGTPLDFIGDDTWELVMNYNQSMSGYQCSDCEDPTILPLSGKLEYRIYADNGAREMLGANCIVPLPISRTSRFFEAPSFHCYPWFFSQFGTVTDIFVTASNDSFIGQRQIGVYFPPSYTENYLKSYPVIIAFDAGRTLLSFMADFLAIHVGVFATVDEAIIIGSEDYRTVEGRDPEKFLYANDRSDLLCPVTSVAYSCVNGTLADGCNFCVANVTDRQDFWRQMKRCGEEVHFGGRGYDYINYFVQDVFERLRVITENRILTDRNNVLLSGCSFGGLLACHAGWTMPDTFGMVACQSPSLYFPMNEDLEHEFEFLNVTLLTQRENRPHQLFYMDAGALEEEGNVLFAESVLAASHSMKQLDVFTLHDNLWTNIYMDQTHGNVQCLARLWVVQQLMLGSKGAPGNPEFRRDSF